MPCVVCCRLRGGCLMEAVVYLRDVVCALCSHCRVLFSSVVNGLMR